MDRIANDKANISAAVQIIDGPVGVSNHRLACKPPNAATTAADVAQSTMASGLRARLESLLAATNASRTRRITLFCPSHWTANCTGRSQIP